MSWLLELDKNIFLYLNGIHSPMWDDIMWWISGKTSWIPLYVVLLLIIVFRELPHRFIYTIVFAAIVVLLCDQIAGLIKVWVARPRPTQDPAIAEIVHKYFVNGKYYTGGKFGFVSAHAANTFGIAAFLASWFNNYKWGLFLFAWAAIVSYSRIYLGVHYPLDIICGALLGVLIGLQCYVFRVRTMVFLEQKIEDRKAANRKKAEQKNS